MGVCCESGTTVRGSGAVIPAVYAPAAVLSATPWALRGVADGIPGTDGRADSATSRSGAKY